MSIAALQITRLCRHLGAFPALTDVSLTVERGEHVALIGPSGSGKAMLLRCLRELDTFQRGRVEVAGEVIAPPARPSADVLARMRHSLPCVAAEPGLQTRRTVLGCCASIAARNGVPPAFAEDDASAVLARLGLTGLAGLATDSLTPGDQQRAALAQAVTARGEVMLIEDPTAMLDEVEAGAVLDLIAHVAAAGTTMLSATESLDFVRRCADRVVFMDHGRVVEIAATERFFNGPASARAAEFLAQRAD